MTATVALFIRELERRWLILPSALVVGVLPLAFNGLGWIQLPPVLGGLVVAVLLGTVCALVTGYGAFAGEMAAGRLSFFFSRPIPWWSLWSARMSAAILLTGAAGVLAAVPLLFLGEGQLSGVHLTALLNPRGAVVALGWIILMIGVGHAAGAGYASRSRRIALDLLLLWLWAYAVWAARWVIHFAVPIAQRLDRDIELHLHWIPALALLAASAIQVRNGRSDATRGHSLFSATTWSLLFGAWAVLAGVGWFERSRPPADLETITLVAPAAQGDWAWIQGQRRGRWRPPFLVNLASGAWHRMGFGPAVAFSPDGTKAVTVDDDGDGRRLRYLTLGEKMTVREVPIQGYWRGWHHLAFTPAGAAVLSIQQGSKAPYQIDLRSVPSGERRWQLMWDAPCLPEVAFPGPDHALIYRRAANGTEIVRLSLADGATTVAGVLDGGASAARANPSGDRLLVFHSAPARPASARLHDGTTGRLLATIAGEATAVDGGFLADGRAAVAAVRESQTVLMVHGRDGDEEARVGLGRAAHVTVGGEPSPGRLLVELRAPDLRTEVVLVDLSTLAVQRHPRVSLCLRHWVPCLPRPQPGTVGAMLVRTEPGRLARLNGNGELTELLLPR